MTGTPGAEIIELGRADATVESVIQRLKMYEDRIAGITCVITWDDGSVQVAGNRTKITNVAADALTLTDYVQRGLR